MRKLKHSGIIKGLSKMVEQLAECSKQNEEQVIKNTEKIQVINQNSVECQTEADKAINTADKLREIIG